MSARSRSSEARREIEERLAAALTAADRDSAPHPPDGAGLVVAFSGGPDSCALLLGAVDHSADRGLPLWAVHVDHRLDPGSAQRAAAARDIAGALGVRTRVVASRQQPRPGSSLEAHARRARYRILERERRRLGAAWILTAHHRDDQLETLLLRLRQGTGVRGMRGIRPRLDRVLRPLLDVERRRLHEALGASPALSPILDPTNDSLRHARNRVRGRLIPALSAAATTAASGELSQLAARVADLAGRVRRQVDRRLAAAVELRRDPGVPGTSLSTAPFLALPPALRPWAIALLCERNGEPYPPPGRAVGELVRQLERHGRARCDWAARRRLESRHGRLTTIVARSAGAEAEGF